MRIFLFIVKIEISIRHPCGLATDSGIYTGKLIWREKRIRPQYWMSLPGGRV